MKKILSLIIAAMLVLSCFAGCAPKETGGVSSATASQEESEFQKPESYASVVLVTINPQFRLYLDTQGVVLAVEPVNADAKTIETKITFENKKVAEVVGNLVVAANDGGFIKENAAIDIKIATNNNAEDKDLEAVLTTVKASVSAKLGELKVTAEVKTEISQEIIPEEDTTSSEASSEANSSEDNSSKENSSTESEKPTVSNTVSEKPVCKHAKTKSEPVNTGKNIIDASKYDIINHKVICADCKAFVKYEAHKIADSKCTLCGQNNFNMKTVNIIIAGPTLEGDLKVNADGSPAFEVMLNTTWQSAITPEYTVDEFNYKIPAEAMLKAIRTKFVISDAQFEKLKAQGEYKFFLDTHTFKDGYFNIVWPAAGGPGEHTHKNVGYIDNKAGKFTVYYDYMSGGADVEEHEHISYYAVEYKYSGYSNLSIQKAEWRNNILGFESVVDSMRITSIKEISSLPANMTKI